MSNRYLVLDIATVTGWSAWGGGVITSGSQRFGASEHRGERFAQFHRWLSAKIQEDKPDQVVYEGAGYFKSAAAAEVCIGLRGVMLALVGSHSIPCVSYAPSEVKRFWTGKGTADKFQMMEVTRKRCPEIELTDSNESDALAMLHLHLERTGAIAPAILLPTVH